MGKRSRIKEQTNSPAAEKHDLILVRPSSRSLQRIAKPIEATVAHSAAVGNGTTQLQRIALRAYHLWEAQGRPSGTDREDWFEAERLVGAETPRSESWIDPKS